MSQFLAGLSFFEFTAQYAPGGAGDSANGGNTARMREELQERWNELKTPLSDRVDCLSAMLDAAPASPELVVRPTTTEIISVRVLTGLPLFLFPFSGALRSCSGEALGSSAHRSVGKSQAVY